MKCGRCMSTKKPAAPMLEDDVWRKLAKPYELLCVKCAFARARKQGIVLGFNDLLPCEFNLAMPWFDKFRAAEDPHKLVAPARAWAWQCAMLKHYRQAEKDLLALFPRDCGTVLAAYRGWTLREAPEGGICRGFDEIDWAGGEKYLRATEHGFEVEILIRPHGERGARIEEIISPYGPNSIGPVRMRAVSRLLQMAFPNLETLGGFRTTGARFRKPEEVDFKLEHIAGGNPLRINQYAPAEPKPSNSPLGGLY